MTSCRKIALFTFCVISPFINNSLAQEYKGFSKSELRYEIDQLKEINRSLSVEISNKNETINNLQTEIKSSKENEKKQRAEISNLKTHLNQLATERDSLSQIIAEKEELSDTEENQKSDDSYYSLIQGGLEPIGWSNDGKFGYRRVFSNAFIGAYGSEISIIDLNRSKVNKLHEEGIEEMAGNESTESYKNNLQKKIAELIINHRLLWTNGDTYYQFSEPTNIIKDSIQYLYNEESDHYTFYYNRSVSYNLNNEITLKLESGIGFWKLYAYVDGIRRNIGEGKLTLAEMDYENPNLLFLPPETIRLKGFMISPWDDDSYVIFLETTDYDHQHDEELGIELTGFRK
jgi:hypothetical protein